MFDSFRLSPVKFNIFSSIFVASIILLIVFADSLISNYRSLPSNAFGDRSSHQELQTHKFSAETLSPRLENVNLPHTGYLVPPFEEKGTSMEETLKVASLLEMATLALRFSTRMKRFLGNNQCKVHFFMTWISTPAELFGRRELFAMESLFKNNPQGCLVILSSSLDTRQGYRILRPLIKRGFKIEAMTPDFTHLFSQTPAEDWLNEIKSGKNDPGQIPLAQNLSNLIRLAALYKYGGVYLDTDFIVLKDFSGLKNSIGAQSVDVNGKWSRLNNAVLVFDEKHPLVYKFLEEFALTFDGNRWGHNGPYLVSRVVDRVANTKEFNFTILPPIAFYPVDWNRVGGFFHRPIDRMSAKWVEAKIRQLHGSTYGVHLWNSQSRGLKIEDGSIIGRLISDNCIMCQRIYSS